MSLKIECNDRHEMWMVLSKLERQGYRWQSGDRPTKFNYFDIYPHVFAQDNMELTSCYYGTDIVKSVSAQEFLIGSFETNASDRKTDAIESMIALCDLDSDKIGCDAKDKIMNILLEVRESRLNKGYRVGDIIKVVDHGAAYSTYVKWVSNHVSSEYDKYAFDLHHSPENGMIGTVIAIGKHDTPDIVDDTLIYFRDNESERCYLISYEGVELVSRGE